MSALPDEARLSRIQTLWTQMLSPDQTTIDTTRQLLLRYHGAAYRYLLGTVRDAAIAEELAQDFAVRFLRGDFQSADPARGRFRDFLKTSLRNLVRDYWRKNERQKQNAPLPDDVAADPVEQNESDALFIAGWREELLAGAWDALAEYEQSTGKPYNSVLRLKTREPQFSSPELADRLGHELQKTYTPEAARQVLHRAREQFASLLLDEALASLPSPDLDRLEEELGELQLLDYCRIALDRRRAETNSTG
jgi:DNA-directed RNA polymerase specialized sigma24 family protein